MKERKKFLRLVGQIRNSGIVDVLSNAKNAQEMKFLWEDIIKENSELVREIQKWEQNELYFPSGALRCENIIRKGELIENPMEMILIPFMSGDKDFAFDDICDSEWLIEPLRKTENKIANVVADFIEKGIQDVEDIRAEDIFEALK